MAKTKTTRQSTPKTAYELLERVCEAIRDNPLNYWQGYWRASRRHKGVAKRNTARLPECLDTPTNECGTAFCRAGWIVALHDGPDTRRDIELRAHQLLGSDWGYDRFNDDAIELFTSYAVCGEPGTRDYVRRGVSGVRAFMRKHERRLKARLLKDVPKRA